VKRFSEHVFMMWMCTEEHAVIRLDYDFYLWTYLVSLTVQLIRSIVPFLVQMEIKKEPVAKNLTKLYSGLFIQDTRSSTESK
jgi:hypothetical protein